MANQTNGPQIDSASTLGSLLDSGERTISLAACDVPNEICRWSATSTNHIADFTLLIKKPICMHEMIRKSWRHRCGPIPSAHFSFFYASHLARPKNNQLSSFA